MPVDAPALAAPSRTPVASSAADAPGALSIPAYRLLIVVQLLFWSSSATFLMLPKYLAVTLHATATWIGLIMGGLGIGAVAMAPFISVLARRCGRRQCLVAAHVMLAVGSLLFIPVDVPGPLAIVARAIQGAAGALLYAHGSVLVADLVHPQRLPSAIALYMTAGLVPNIVSPPAAEWLLEHHGPIGVFIGASLIAVLGAVLAGHLPDRTSARSDGAVRRSHRPASGLLAISVIFGAAGGSVMSFHQPLALAQGATHVSAFLVAFTITATLLRLVGGRFLDHVGCHRMAVWTGAGYALVLVAMACMQPWSLMLLGVVFGVTHGLFFPNFVAVALGAGDRDGRESRMAWIGATDKTGHMMVIPLGLIAAQAGYPVVFLIMAPLAGIATWALSRMHPGR
jgi:MFS family permease